jgi:hypothetical protein
MAEAALPARPADNAWSRLAFRILAAIAVAALGTIISFIFWMALGLILMSLFGGIPPIDF